MSRKFKVLAVLSVFIILIAMNFTLPKIYPYPIKKDIQTNVRVQYEDTENSKYKVNSSDSSLSKRLKEQIMQSSILENQIKSELDIYDIEYSMGWPTKNDKLSFKITNNSMYPIDEIAFNIYFYNKDHILIDTLDSTFGYKSTSNGNFKIPPGDTVYHNIENLKYKKIEKVVININHVLRFIE